MKRWTDQQPQERNKPDNGLYNVPHSDGEWTRQTILRRSAAQFGFKIQNFGDFL